MPVLIFNINIIPEYPLPTPSGGSCDISFIWGSDYCTCTAGVVRRLFHFYLNADSAHPLSATALSKYGVMLAPFFRESPGGGSLHAAFLSTAPSVLGNAHSTYYSVANTSVPPHRSNCFNNPFCFKCGISHITGTSSMRALTTTTGRHSVNSNEDGIGKSNTSHFEREPNDMDLYRNGCTPEVDQPLYVINGARDTPTVCRLPPSVVASQAGMHKQ
jgi:hypothetical protein